MDPIDRIIIDHKRSNLKNMGNDDVQVTIPDNANSGDVQVTIPDNANSGDVQVTIPDNSNSGDSANELDDLAIKMCDELIVELKSNITECEKKAFRLKVLDTLFYLVIHALSFTVFVIGLYQGTKSSSEGDSKWFYITSILTGVGTLLTEIGKRYNFKGKSVQVYDSAQKYESFSLELRELRVSPISGSAKIVRIREIENLVSSIQVDVFT